MYYIHKLLLLYVLYCQDSSVPCLLLSNDKFYIHFGGSLEYWRSEYDYEYEYGHMSGRNMLVVTM